MKNVLITGISGFIGSALQRHLSWEPDVVLRGLVRRRINTLPAQLQTVIVEDLGGQADYREAVENIDVIVHAAARVHIMDDQSANPLADYRRVNVDGTLQLARQAAGAGVKRFIFISSIKVNGEFTAPDRPFRASDTPAPQDFYAVSKFEAEEGLKQLASQTGMEVTIIRPPLVYGPGVKANFLAMMKWLYRGLPLPLGAIHNQRSLVALDNLVDLLSHCLCHPAAANQTVLVSDGDDLSTTDLLRRTAAALGKTARLIPVPQSLLEKAATFFGKHALGQRLCASLQVDISATKRLLDWSPPVSVDQALEKTAQYFLESRHG